MITTRVARERLRREGATCVAARLPLARSPSPLAIRSSSSLASCSPAQHTPQPLAACMLAARLLATRHAPQLLAALARTLLPHRARRLLAHRSAALSLTVCLALARSQLARLALSSVFRDTIDLRDEKKGALGVRGLHAKVGYSPAKDSSKQKNKKR